MKFEFPDKGRISQINKGEAFGSLHHSYGIDFSTETARIISSPACLTHMNGLTTAGITAPVISFLTQDSRWYGIADDVYRGGSNQVEDPTNGWALDTSTATPQVTVTEGDAAFFDAGIKVSGISGGGDIYSFDGATWSSWWVGTLSQSALNTSSRKMLRVGGTGRLYIADDFGRKIYNVTTAGVVTKTGNGTLDLSDREYDLKCMESSSDRLWIAGRDRGTASGVVIEWDMSLNEATPNRIHLVGGTSVISICIWNDSPVLMLSDGTMRFFDGSSFYKKDGANLPKPLKGFSYRGDYVSTAVLDTSSFNMHPNGSAVIDDLPHFLMAGVMRAGGTNSLSEDYKYVSGIFCYDPDIGLYNRFPLEGASGTHGFGGETDSGTQIMGALAAAPSSKTSFLASCMIRYETDIYAIIFSDDKARTLASRGRFILNPFYGTAKDLWQRVEVLAKRLGDSSDRILLKYRLNKSSTKPFKAAITWVDNDTFTSTDTDFANAEVGDFVLVAYDQGGNCSAHISAISYSNPTYTITLDEPITGITTPETGLVRVDNFRRLATISNQKTDYHDISVNTTEGSHTFWLMVELRAAAGSVVELDKIIVTSQEGN